MIYNGLEWSDELLDDGSSKTQREWSVWCKLNGWKLPSIKDYEGLRGCEDKKFMSALEKDMKEYWLLTSDVLKNPFDNTERPVVLGVLGNIDRFNILAVGIVDYYSGPARGVVGIKKKVKTK